MARLSLVSLLCCAVKIDAIAVVTKTKVEHITSDTQAMVQSVTCPNYTIPVKCPRFAGLKLYTCLSTACATNKAVWPAQKVGNNDLYDTDTGYAYSQEIGPSGKNVFWSKNSYMTNPLESNPTFSEQEEMAAKGEPCMLTWMNEVASKLKDRGMSLYMDFCDPGAACATDSYGPTDRWQDGGRHIQAVKNWLRAGVNEAGVFVEAKGSEGPYCFAEHSQALLQRTQRGLPIVEFAPVYAGKYAQDPRAEGGDKADEAAKYLIELVTRAT